MRWIDRIRMAMIVLFRRGDETIRLNDELQFHLERQIEENIARGMAPEQARSAAMRSFGNPTHLREEARSHWNWNWLEKFWRDVRYGFRTLWRSPGFALVAIAVMALGIGATTSLFTIVRAVLLKPLPFRDPQNLVMVYERFRHAPNSGGGFNVVAPADYYDWRAQTHGFQDMATWRNWEFNLSGERGELPEVAQAAAGSSNLFSVLGVKPALGRTFTETEDSLGGNRVAMLTWSLFQRRFSGNRAVIGQQVRLDAKPYTIVGVLPREFTYPGPKIQLWVPYASVATAEGLAAHDNHSSYVIARMKPDVGLTAAMGEVSALQYRMHMDHLDQPVAEDAVTRPVIDDVVQNVKTPLMVMLCAVGCMLLIACLNISNLLVARGAARRKEVAVRGALGGSRLTLIREQMTESLLICCAGGVLGVLLSLATTQWLAGHWRGLPRADAIHLDGLVLAFSAGLVFLTAALAGLLPAISSTRKGVLGALQDSSRSVAGSISRAWLRKALLTTEIALTVVLLTSAGLLLKSFVQLRATQLGCATENILTMSYSLPVKQYSKREQVVAFHQELLDRVRHLPGVVAAGLGTVVPGGGYGGDQIFTIPERPSQKAAVEQDAIYRMADPGYFSALQIPLVSGRFFSEQDRLDRAKQVIISAQLEREYFGGENPLGKHLNVSWDMKREDFEIIGVVGDTLHHVGEPSKATMYFPVLSGLGGHGMTLVVRTASDPLAFSVPVQKQVAALDRGLPVSDVLTIQQIVGQSIASQSFSATIVLAFAAISLLLAAIGLYGVLSYLVLQRVTELGIRMALGAQRSQVLRLVLLDGLMPVLIGLATGLAASAGAGALIRSMLYGTQPFDATVVAAMTAVLFATAFAACVVPALRASRIEPMQALRS